MVRLHSLLKYDSDALRLGRGLLILEHCALAGSTPVTVLSLSLWRWTPFRTLRLSTVHGSVKDEVQFLTFTTKNGPIVQRLEHMTVNHAM